MATIRDIAKLAGVAPSTVSHVLNGTAPVSEKTKTRVKQVIDKYQFQPNLIAKSLKSKQTFSIGVLTDNINSPFVPPMINGIEEYLFQHGYSTLIGQIHPEDRDGYKKLFESRQVDGMIFASSWVHEVEVNISDVPSTYVYGYTQDLSGDYVIPNDFQGAYEATMHLIQLGHNKIGFINGPMDWHASIERLDGFRAAHKEAGISLQPVWIKSGDWSPEMGYELAKELIEKKNSPTAIFAANDEMASGVYKYCWETGIRIPDDLSVVGFDNQYLSSFFLPKLTTVELPLNKMGQLAAERLLRKLTEGDNSDLPTRVPCQLITRNSTSRVSHTTSEFASVIVEGGDVYT